MGAIAQYNSNCNCMYCLTLLAIYIYMYEVDVNPQIQHPVVDMSVHSLASRSGQPVVGKRAAAGLRLPVPYSSWYSTVLVGCEHMKT